jgi:hypothetical protein
VKRPSPYSSNQLNAQSKTSKPAQASTQAHEKATPLQVCPLPDKENQPERANVYQKPPKKKFSPSATIVDIYSRKNSKNSTKHAARA